jgi:hypothetical protein
MNIDYDLQSDDWYYDLKWIIIRRVKRARDPKHEFLYARQHFLPDWFYKEYDKSLHVFKEHPYAQHWSKTDEKLFSARQLVKNYVAK